MSLSLLAEGKSIGEIARAVGYDSAAAFSTRVQAVLRCLAFELRLGDSARRAQPSSRRILVLNEETIMPIATAPDGSEHHAVITTLVVTDVDRAIEFYHRGFRLERDSAHTWTGRKDCSRPGAHRDTILFLAVEPVNRAYLSPESLSGTTCGVYLYSGDCDAAFRKAVAAGAASLSEPEQLLGDRVALVRDPFGHLWSLATRLR